MGRPTAGAHQTIGPQPGPQTTFLASSADIAILGGAAGGGKSWALLLEALRHTDNPKFGAVIFRRTYPEITNEGALWDESGNLYPLLGARPNQNELEWVFPSKARVSFRHLQHETDKFNYQGAQIPLLGFDQLERFSGSQFFYMLSRNRSTCGVRPYVRGTCNPDPDSFLAPFLEWWIDQETGFAIPERAGQVRWFVRTDAEELIWADTAQELTERYPQLLPKSATFIPASIYDNKILLEKDPGYLANLMALPLVERERLLNGNWKVKASAGKVVNRAWFETVAATPAGGELCRFWDFAATKKQMAGEDPDYTAGVRIRRVGALYFVEDVLAGQWNPAEVDRFFMNTTRTDVQFAAWTQAHYRVRWEVEPGSASIRENRRLVSMLSGIPCGGVRAPTRKDPLIRGRAFASQAEGGNVKVLSAPWTEGFLNHLHAIPDGKHDDVWEATLGSFNSLTAVETRAASTSRR